MKTKTFETAKAKVMVIDLPTDIKKPFVCGEELQNVVGKMVLKICDLPKPTQGLYSDWKLYGFLKELTEEQKESIVESLFGDSDWKNYCEEIKLGYEKYPFLTASESFDSLLKSQELYLENPLGEKEPEDISDLGAFTQQRRKLWWEWKKYEEKVFRNPVIIVEFKN